MKLLRSENVQMLILTCLLGVISNLTVSDVIPVIAFATQSFGVGASMVGVAMGMAGFAKVIFAIPSGQTLEKLGAQYALLAGGFAYIIGNGLAAISHSFAVFAAGRFIHGLGASLVLITTQQMVMDITTPTNRGRMTGIFRTATNLALVAGSYPGGVLGAHYGLRAPFFLNSALGLLICVVAAFKVQASQDKIEQPEASSKVKIETASQKLKLVFSNRNFLFAAIVGFALYFTRFGVYPVLIPLIAKDRLNIGVETLGVIISAVSTVALVCAYPFGWLSDRFGHKTVIVPAIFIAGAAMVMIQAGTAMNWFLLGCFLFGISFSIANIVPIAYAVTLFPRRASATVVSGFSLATDLGIFLGPIIVGSLADVLSINSALIVIASILAILALLFALFSSPTKQEQQEEIGI